MKYFVVTDVHNCFDALVAALGGAGFDKTNSEHKVLFLGDAFEKGTQPKETYLFLRELVNESKLIWVRGNHDIELVNALKKSTLNKTNRPTALALSDVFEKIGNNADDARICEVLLQNGFTNWIVEHSQDFFETEHYVFVHGFVPLNKGKYVANWRELPSDMWGGARKACAVRAVLKNGIRIDGKTVVSGHVGAYYGHIKDEHPDLEFDSPDFKRIAQRIASKKEKKYYKPFYGDGVIALDANAYATGFMNCIVLED